MLSPGCNYLGLHNASFEKHFQKIILLWEVIDDPALLGQICDYLSVKELLIFLSISKKLNQYRKIPLIEVRILKQKVKMLERPKQIIILGFNPIPSYCDFMFKKNIDQKDLKNISSESFDKLMQFQKKFIQLKNKKKQKLKQDNQARVILKKQQQNDNLFKQIQKQIKTKDIQEVKLSNQPEIIVRQYNSYVDKFRKQYQKLKEFQQKQNVNRLKEMHKRQKQTDLVKKFNCDQSVPIIKIQTGQTIYARSLEPSLLRKKVQTVLYRFKVVLGL